MRGFIPYSNSDGRVLPWKYLPCGAIQPKIGLALYQSGGVFAIATGTQKPTHICMRDEAAAVSSGTVIPVVEVEDDIIWECTNSADLTSVNIGSKVTLHGSNGLQITATTDSGVARIVAKDGNASGSRCLVKFD